MKLKSFLTLALTLWCSAPASAMVMVSPPSLDYGLIRLGFSSSRFVSIQNWGPNPVRVFGCSAFGSYWCQLQCPGVLPAGQSCSALIQFFPRFEGTELQTAQIQTNESFLNVFLRGTAVR
jgi:hypothetical protein